MTAGKASMVMRPHPLFVLLEPIRFYGWVAAACVFALLAVQAWAWLGLGGAPGAASIVFWSLMALALRFLWAVADWATRTYGLTEGPNGGLVWAARGVLNRRRDELPIAAVRTMSVVKPIEQRLFGIGSVGFGSAGTSGYEVVWWIIGGPDRRLEEARAAARAAEGRPKEAA